MRHRLTHFARYQKRVLLFLSAHGLRGSYSWQTRTQAIFPKIFTLNVYFHFVRAQEILRRRKTDKSIQMYVNSKGGGFQSKQRTNVHVRNINFHFSHVVLWAFSFCTTVGRKKALRLKDKRLVHVGWKCFSGFSPVTVHEIL